MFENLPPEVPPLKTCADCSFLIGVRSQLEYAAGWVCDHPENIKSSSIDPVTGLEKKLRITVNCGEARKNEAFCGAAGRWFSLYERPARVVPPAARGSVGAEALLNELENIK